MSTLLLLVRTSLTTLWPFLWKYFQTIDLFCSIISRNNQRTCTTVAARPSVWTQPITRRSSGFGWGCRRESALRQLRRKSLHKPDCFPHCAWKKPFWRRISPEKLEQLPDSRTDCPLPIATALEVRTESLRYFYRIRNLSRTQLRQPVTDAQKTIHVHIWSVHDRRLHR
jgi:hypothetical protein